MVYQMVMHNALFSKELFTKKKVMTHTHRTRLITKDSIIQFQELLSNNTWDSIYLNNDANGIFNAFLNTFLNIFEASFPITYINNVRNNGWITKGIKISCRCKRSLYILSRNCNDLNLKLYYQYCAIIRKVIREAKKSYYNHLIDVSKNKMKTTWSIIKNVTGKVHTSDNMPPSFKIGDTVVPTDKAAEAWNNYFLNITGSLNVQNVKDNSPI
jgi:hypothetical protein